MPLLLPLLALLLQLVLLLAQQLLLHALKQAANVALPGLHLPFNMLCYLLQVAGYVAAEHCQSLLHTLPGSRTILMTH